MFKKIREFKHNHIDKIHVHSKKYRQFKQKAKETKKKQLKNVNLDDYQKDTVFHAWNNKLKKYGINTFHKSIFTVWTSFALFLLLFLLGRLFGGLIAFIFLHVTGQHLTTYFTQYDMQGTLNVITYITTQLIPLLLTMIIMCNKGKIMNWWIQHGWSKQPYLYKHARWTFFYVFKKWTHIIINDIKNHWKLIIIMTVLVAGVHMLSNMFFLLVSSPGVTSPDTVRLAQLLHQSWWMYPMVLVVGPAFEETMFRVAIPNTLFGLFNLNHFGKGKALGIKYWCASILSAMSFASLHEGADASWGTLASFVIFALLLQWLYHRSHSIVLPLTVHGLSNLVVVLPYLF